MYTDMWTKQVEDAYGTAPRSKKRAKPDGFDPFQGVPFDPVASDLNMTDDQNDIMDFFPGPEFGTNYPMFGTANNDDFYGATVPDFMDLPSTLPTEPFPFIPPKQQPNHSPNTTTSTQPHFEDQVMQMNDTNPVQTQANSGEHVNNAPMIQFPPKPPSQNSLFLIELHKRSQNIKVELEKVRWVQREVVGVAKEAARADSLQGLAKQHKAIHQELDISLKSLDTLFCESLLEAAEIHKVSSLKNDLQIDLRQLEMYEMELAEYIQPTNGRPNVQQRVVASLVITKQPFPKSVKQSKPVESGVTVRLLTGAIPSVWPAGALKAEIATDYPSRAKKNPITVKNNIKEMENGVANFNDMIFPTGTRKKPIHIKFKMDVQHGSSKSTIESNISDPIIVKTNENQWQESDGMLLRHEAFGNGAECPWFKFANALQRRYLAATKQDKQQPARPLSIQDLNYIYHAKFSPNTMPTKNTVINAKQFDNFWVWFGPGLFKIRYQRHLCALWVRGYICGFIGRTEAEAILENASPGAFIIRFSEQCPGQFAIAYIPLDNNPGSSGPFGAGGGGGGTVSDGNARIRHYLMQPNDVFGSKKTLADFLGSAKNFSHIVQIIDHPTSGRIFQQCSKDAVLLEYYSKRSADGFFGYDNKL